MFNKEKDFILKITNLVLYIGLVSAIVAFYMMLVTNFVTSPTLSREEHKIAGCPTYYYGSYYYDPYVEKNPTASITDEECNENYVVYLKNVEDNNFNNRKGIYLSGGAVIIVFSALYFLNRKKED